MAGRDAEAKDGANLGVDGVVFGLLGGANRDGGLGAAANDSGDLCAVGPIVVSTTNMRESSER